ncbi:MAG: hypothetical protein IJK61_04930 [Bacteroidetes bacterium]|nr:hypothetical protein [Bacteroidota bacterium]
MIFVLQAGLYDLLPKKPMADLGYNVFFYEKYNFYVLNEDDNIKKNALSTNTIMASLLHQRENYLYKIASAFIAIQLNNPYMDYLINFPSFSIEEIVKYINEIKSQLRLYNKYDDRFENFKKVYQLKPYIQNFAMDSIQVCPVYFSETLFVQVVNMIEQKVNININTLKSNYMSDLNYIAKKYKKETIGEIDSLDYNLYEALADIIYYLKTKKDRRFFIRRHKLFFD